MTAATIGEKQTMYEMRDDGGLRLNFHPGQLRAWDCDRRFVAVLAGTQGG
jgi:hypothetical protein